MQLLNEAGEGPRGTTLVRVDPRNDRFVTIRNVTVQRGDFGAVAEVGRLAPGDYDVSAMYAGFNPAPTK